MDDLDSIRRNLALLDTSAESFLNRLPEIQRRNQWRERNKRFLANPKTAARAQRVLDQQGEVISEYYRQFRRFTGNVNRTFQSLKGRIPAHELVKLIRDADPSMRGYRISDICQAVQRAKLLDELYRCRDLRRAVDLHTLLREICKKKEITIDKWLRDHSIDRSQYYLSKKAGGKPIEGKVALNMADKIKAAILEDGVKLQLITVHDNVHDI